MKDYLTFYQQSQSNNRVIIKEKVGFNYALLAMISISLISCVYNQITLAIVFVIIYIFFIFKKTIEFSKMQNKLLRNYKLINILGTKYSYKESKKYVFERKE